MKPKQMDWGFVDETPSRSIINGTKANVLGRDKKGGPLIRVFFKINQVFMQNKSAFKMHPTGISKKTTGI